MAEFTDDFDGPGLDRTVWMPYYLPHWSSRATSAAAFDVRDSLVRLTIPVDQGLWCADVHSPSLRVSGIQSGHLDGQQPFVDAQRVAEPQAELRGWLPSEGLFEVRARMGLSPRSMASVWMVGFEDAPERCGEICVFEIFGDSGSADGATYEVGQGVHPFRDPSLTDDFAAPPRTIDIGEHHVFGAERTRGRTVFSIDGEIVRTVDQAPDYPLQVMIGVFDFPEREGPDDHEPWLEVDWVRGPSGRYKVSATV
ncbi:MAG: glycoside hydrolase family 16 protein [Aeromicrobium sp.]